MIASDTTINGSVEITDIPISLVGEYRFTILDDYGDGLGGSDLASYRIAIDGNVVIDSGANPNFGSSVSETFTVSSTTTATDGDGIADVVDDVDGWDVNDADVDGSGNFALADTDNDTAPDGSGATPLLHDLDFRDAVSCFTPGTLITTDKGEMPVENLRPGDTVLTADKGFQPIRWVGQRTLTQDELSRMPNLRPVVIRKNAFGNRRRMLVSPQHGLVYHVDGEQRLIRAKHAAEAFGGKVARIDRHCESATYIHIMFDQHQLVFAEGAPSESFFPGPMALNSLDHEALMELLFLFPELTRETRGNSLEQNGYGDPVRPYLRRKDVLSAVRQAA